MDFSTPSCVIGTSLGFCKYGEVETASHLQPGVETASHLQTGVESASHCAFLHLHMWSPPVADLDLFTDSHLNTHLENYTDYC